MHRFERVTWAGMLAVLLLGCASGHETMSVVVEPPVSAPASAEPAGGSAEAEASVIAFVRHAEKASDGSEDPPLTPEGEARARCLVHVLDGFGATALWSTPYTRTRQTLAPLSDAAGLQVEELDASATEAWIAKLKSAGADARVVVAAHSNTIPQWITALGGDPGPVDPQGNIPHDEYDRIVFVVLDAQGEHVATIVHRYC